mmetsp:Transcript_12471/g.17897  ORF Transcript_12471/g.17897 Transcript_12471/m.17897 type:complete len:211 (-) Transcript_12471:6-638(-)
MGVGDGAEAIVLLISAEGDFVSVELVSVDVLFSIAVSFLSTVAVGAVEGAAVAAVTLLFDDGDDVALAAELSPSSLIVEFAALVVLVVVGSNEIDGEDDGNGDTVSFILVVPFIMVGKDDDDGELDGNRDGSVVFKSSSVVEDGPDVIDGSIDGNTDNNISEDGADERDAAIDGDGDPWDDPDGVCDDIIVGREEDRIEGVKLRDGALDP